MFNNINENFEYIKIAEEHKMVECCLCGTHIHSVYEGNDPYPLGDEGDQCCYHCNMLYVIPERLGMNDSEKQNWRQSHLEELNNSQL